VAWLLLACFALRQDVCVFENVNTERSLELGVMQFMQMQILGGAAQGLRHMVVHILEHMVVHVLEQMSVVVLLHMSVVVLLHAILPILPMLLQLVLRCHLHAIGARHHMRGRDDSGACDASRAGAQGLRHRETRHAGWHRETRHAGWRRETSDAGWHKALSV
jgi:hypothetical protein